MKIVHYCRLCDWSYTEAPPEVTVADHRATLDETIRAAISRQNAELEAAVVEHLVEAHTAPVVLAQT